jgi:hypothetical protein
LLEDTLRRYDQEVITDDIQPFIHLYLDLKRSPHLLVKKTGMMRYVRSLDPTEHKAWGRANTIAMELCDNHMTNKVRRKSEECVAVDIDILLVVYRERLFEVSVVVVFVAVVVVPFIYYIPISKPLILFRSKRRRPQTL